MTLRSVLGRCGLGALVAVLVLGVGACGAGSGDGAGPGTSPAPAGTADTAGDPEGDPGRGPGTAGPCPDRAEQVPGDPYSPGCIEWDGGDNGGATAPGVTGAEVVATFRYVPEAMEPDEPSVELLDLTLGRLAEYFSDRFELYGRRLRVEVGTTTGSADHDADLAVSQGAFAELWVPHAAYLAALASREVVALGVPPLPASPDLLVAHAPFAWHVGPNQQVPVPAMQTIGYAAFKSVGDPAEEPSQLVDLLYYQLSVLALGVQGAGPLLTPESFSEGLHRLEPRLGPLGYLAPRRGHHVVFHGWHDETTPVEPPPA